jgi:hypothetical protein
MNCLEVEDDIKKIMPYKSLLKDIHFKDDKIICDIEGDKYIEKPGLQIIVNNWWGALSKNYVTSSCVCGLYMIFFQFFFDSI